MQLLPATQVITPGCALTVLHNSLCYGLDCRYVLERALLDLLIHLKWDAGYWCKDNNHIYSLKYHILIWYVAYLIVGVSDVWSTCGFLFGCYSQSIKNIYFHIQNVYEFLLLSKKQDIYLTNPLQFLNRASLTVSTHFE